MNPADVKARLLAMQARGATPLDIQEILADLETSQELDEDEQEDLSQFRGSLAGRSVALNPPNNTNPPSSGLWVAGQPVDLITARFHKPRVVTLTLNADGTGAFATILTQIGSALRTQYVPLSVFPRSMQVYGSAINVSVTAGIPPQAPTGSAGDATKPTAQNATGILSPQGVDPLGDVWPVWSGQKGFGTTWHFQIAGAGVLLGAFGSLVALGTGDTQEWLMAFDLPGTATPAGGALPLLTIGPLTSAGMPFSIERSLRPSWYFDTGLNWQLSKNGATFATPGAGASFSVFFDWAQ